MRIMLKAGAEFWVLEVFAEKKKTSGILQQSSGFTNEEKPQGRKTRWLVPCLTVVGDQILGWKDRYRKKEHRRIELIVRSLLQELHDFRASRNNYSKFCTRVSLRQVTDKSPMFLGYYSQFCSPGICYMCFGNSSHSLAFRFPSAWWR